MIQLPLLTLPAASPTAEAPASTPASPPKKDAHGLSITFDADTAFNAGAGAQLTPEQHYQLELARAQHPSSRALEGILIPCGFFLMIFGIVAVTVWARLRRNRMMHDTVRLFAEKGQPLPPEIFLETPTAPKPKSDLRRGIFWMAIGLGLIGYFGVVDHDRSWGLGFIPLCIGLGYLLACKLDTPSKPGSGV